MVLSDDTIKETIFHHYPLVEPFNEQNLSPASIDLTLADDFVDENGVRTRLEDGLNAFNILPGEFWLMSTKEKISVPDDMVAVVKGKSSLARKGLMVECAGFVDPQFSGQITLEVKNLNKERIISLKPGMKICQIVFMKMDKAATKPYSKENGHHYQGQTGTTVAWDTEEQKMPISYAGKHIKRLVGLNKSGDRVTVRYKFLKPFYYLDNEWGVIDNSTEEDVSSGRILTKGFSYDYDVSYHGWLNIELYIKYFNQLLDDGYIEILNSDIFEWEEVDD